MKFYIATTIIFSFFLNEVASLPSPQAVNSQMMSETKDAMPMSQDMMPMKTGEEMEDDTMAPQSQMQGSMMNGAMMNGAMMNGAMMNGGMMNGGMMNGGQMQSDMMKPSQM